MPLSPVHVAGIEAVAGPAQTPQYPDEVRTPMSLSSHPDMPKVRNCYRLSGKP